MLRSDAILLTRSSNGLTLRPYPLCHPRECGDPEDKGSLPGLDSRLRGNDKRARNDTTQGFEQLLIYKVVLNLLVKISN